MTWIWLEKGNIEKKTDFLLIAGKIMSSELVMSKKK